MKIKLGSYGLEVEMNYSALSEAQKEDLVAFAIRQKIRDELASFPRGAGVAQYTRSLDQAVKKIRSIYNI